jgi:hypothetical protein
MEATISNDEMNVTIAAFMGYHYNAGKFYSNKGGKGNWFKEAKYHSSWDWLMPAVKKIYDTLAEMLKKRPPHTACQGDLIEVDIHCAIREVDILKAHGHVYQFCLWYNKQKEDNNDTN